MRRTTTRNQLDTRAGPRRVWAGEGTRIRARSDRRPWRFGAVQLRVLMLAAFTAAIAWSLMLR